MPRKTRSDATAPDVATAAAAAAAATKAAAAAAAIAAAAANWPLQPEPAVPDMSFLNVDSVADADIRTRLRYVPAALGQVEAPTRDAPLMGFKSIEEMKAWQASDNFDYIKNFDHKTKRSNQGSWPPPQDATTRREKRSRERPDLPPSGTGSVQRVLIMANKITRGICRNGGTNALAFTWVHWPNMDHPIIKTMSACQLAVYTTNVAHIVADTVAQDGGRLVRFINVEHSSTETGLTSADGKAVPHSHALILVPADSACTIRGTVSSLLRKMHCKEKSKWNHEKDEPSNLCWARLQAVTPDDLFYWVLYYMKGNSGNSKSVANGGFSIAEWRDYISATTRYATAFLVQCCWVGTYRGKRYRITPTSRTNQDGSTSVHQYCERNARYTTDFDSQGLGQASQTAEISAAATVAVVDVEEDGMTDRFHRADARENDREASTRLERAIVDDAIFNEDIGGNSAAFSETAAAAGPATVAALEQSLSWHAEK
eukprot:COSAG01_NODE_48_length_31904_cov_21.696997_7_plen_486_part_00